MAKLIENTKTGPQDSLTNGRYHDPGAQTFPFQRIGVWNERWYSARSYCGIVDNNDYWNACVWEYQLCRMKLDPTIALLRQLFIAPILDAGWTVVADDDTPDEIVDYAKEETTKIHDELIRCAGLGCLDWGWAPFEKIDKMRDDGLIGFKIKSLLQSLTMIETDEETGAFTGLSQEDVFLDLQDALLFNFDVEGTDWYGQAPMRSAYKPYLSTNHIDQSRAKMNDRIAASHWVIYYPVGRTPTNPEAEPADQKFEDNYDLAGRIMEKLLADGSAVLPNEIRSELNILNGDSAGQDYQSWRVELLDNGSSSAGFYTDQLRYEDALKARALGFPERAILEGQFGTKAEAVSHGDMAIMGLEKRSKELTQTVSRHLLRQYVELNFGEQWRNSVTLEANPIVDETLQLFLKIYDKFLSNPDILLAEYDDFNLQELRDKIGLPMVEEGSESGNLDDVDESKPDEPPPEDDDNADTE